MHISYTAHDLYYDHYLWTVDRRGQPGSLDLDTTPLDVWQGNEVVLFANTFLNLYVPGHTVEHLYGLEYMIARLLPPYVRSKSDIAIWLARNLKMLEVARRTKIYISI
jgi:hypothetical protein